MKAQGSGDIVLMASIAGRWTWVGEPVYIATKWGVVGLGWTLRKEALEYGVRVTMIEPGMVDTPLVRSTAEGRSELERFATLQRRRRGACRRVRALATRGCRDLANS